MVKATLQKIGSQRLVYLHSRATSVHKVDCYVKTRPKEVCRYRRNVPGNVQALSGNCPGHFRDVSDVQWFSGTFPGISGTCPVNFPENVRDVSRKVLGQFQEHGHSLDMPRKLPEKNAGQTHEMSGKLPGHVQGISAWRSHVNSRCLFSRFYSIMTGSTLPWISVSICGNYSDKPPGAF